MKHQIRRTSKFLSLVLRHKPETIGLELDAQGWASVKDLLEKLASAGREVDLAMLQKVVADNDKQRFIFSEDGARIRANQGHSIPIELNLPEVEPPATLYHGTATRFTDSIFKSGLEKRNRQHVHLSSELETAKNVGGRHGKVVVLLVDSGKMYQDGFVFYCSENGVWLTDAVPVAYLTTME